MSHEATHRWNWINAFLTASLHAAIVNVNQQPTRTFTFKDFIQTYATRLRNGLDKLPPEQIPENYGNKQEFEYIFHLESEIWGHDWERYFSFFADTEQGQETILQTFHFVILFFAIERCLSTFQLIDRREKGTGRKGRRKDLFGYENGIFSVRYAHISELMGPPFYLSADTKIVHVSSSSIQSWESLKLKNVPPNLRAFYETTSRRGHFTGILEASLIRTRKTHLPANFGRKKQRRLPRQTRAWWYDVLWKYSESLRYNRVLPSRTAQEYPLFWNRSVRWITSLILTGLLGIATRKNPDVAEAWQSITRQNSILRNLYKDIDRF